MSAERQCPRCQKIIPDSAPHGLCAACLALAALMDPEESTRDAFTPDEGSDVSASSRLVADYEILGVIARGGMGAVYRARQRRLNRLVALKMIHSGQFAGEAELRRFRLEAETAARLDHLHIVPIYEVGEHESAPFISMKLVEGGSLAERIAKAGERKAGEAGTTPFDLRFSSSLISKIARAIHHAHQRGVLHRDLKPANILLDAGGEPHVTDFGLARLAEADSNLTQAGAVLGTPAYMAPEQAIGGTRELTIAADIYSLGVILYQLITGRLPFEAASTIELLRLVAEHEPARPRMLRSEIDRDLETICLKCLQKDPVRRYATAEELAADLARWQCGEPIRARPVGAWEQALKWARRRPAVAALVGVSAAALAGVITMQFINEANLKRERDFAQRQETAAKNSERATRLNLYAADMYLAGRAIEEGNLALARRTLLTHVPVLVSFPGSKLSPPAEDLRGFEWRYFWHRSEGQQEQVLSGFSNSVNCVAFSPDGRWLAAGGGNRVQWWDVTNRHLVASLIHDHNLIIGSIAFSPDGTSLWTGDSRGKVRFWIEGVRDRVGLITRGTGIVHIAAAAGTANKVALGERNGTDGKADGAVAIYNLFDVLARNERGRPLTNSGGLASFSRDGRWLLTGGGNERVTLHNLVSGETKTVFSREREVFALVLSPDGRNAVLSAYNGYNLVLLDLGTGSIAWPKMGFHGRIFALAYAPDGKTVALACSDHTVRVCDARTGFELRRLDGHTSQVLAVAFSPDGQILASGGKDRTVRLWSMAADAKRDTLSEVGHPVAFSKDGRMLTAAVSDDYPLKFGHHDLAALRWASYPDLTLSSNRYPDLTVHNSGSLRWFLYGGASSNQWRKFGDFVASHTKWTASASAADGSMLALGRRHGEIQLWNAVTSSRLRDIRTGGGAVRRLAFSDDGRGLASAGRSNIVAVWDVATGKSRFHLPAREGGINDLVFSPDGRVLAVAGEDTIVQLHDADTGELKATLAGHDVGLTSVAFSPDGRTLATVAGTTSKLWHLPTRREVGTLLPRGDGHVTFSPDGTVLVLISFQGTARLYRAPVLQTGP